MYTQIVLTSSQSKRLIAKGIVAWEPFRRAYEGGMVVVTRGTTNGYILDEMLGAPFDKMHYVTGRTAPAGRDTSWADATLEELVFERGQRVSGAAPAEAVKRMGPGDLFLKGANALNYERRQAGVLIAHPVGGTLGATLGTIVSRRVRLVHPVGLEKSVPADLAETARRMSEEPALGTACGLYVTHGEVFTEIEALEALFDVEAEPTGSGGIAGAEGGIWLNVFGGKTQLDEVLALVAEVQKEPPFGTAAAGQA